jgi:hypothetical protein
MNKDQIKGRVDEAKGKVKVVTGKLLDNDDMEQNLQKTLVKSKRALLILRMILIKQIEPDVLSCIPLSRLTDLQDTRK